MNRKENKLKKNMRTCEHAHKQKNNRRYAHSKDKNMKIDTILQSKPAVISCALQNGA